MKRRDFLFTNIALFGGMLIGNDFSNLNALNDMSRTFKDVNENYDVIIYGASILGCFTAIKLAALGKNVLVIEKRTSLGYDISFKRKLWIKEKGIRKWNDELYDLFTPIEECNEIFNPIWKKSNRSCFKGELPLFSGSVKKGLLRSLLLNNVDVLLMNEVCGLITQSNNEISGVIVANKLGVYGVRCSCFIDATDNNLFTRNVLDLNYHISKASYVIEIQDAQLDSVNTIEVPSSWQVSNDCLYVHRGKKSTDQYFLSFSFSVNTNNITLIEQEARDLSIQICQNFPTLHKGLKNAKLVYWAYECSYFLESTDVLKSPYRNYFCLSNYPDDYTGGTFVDYLQKASNIGRKLRFSTTSELKNLLLNGNVCDYPFKSKDLKWVEESGRKLPLFKMDLTSISLPIEPATVVIAGGGTAGVSASLSFDGKGVTPVVVEYFNDFGGAKTMGGVVGYYLGQNKNPYIRTLEKKIKDLSSECNIVLNATSRSAFYRRELIRKKCQLKIGTLICGAKVEDSRLTGIAIVESGKLKWLSCRLLIDATGDADIAYFAEEGFEYGDSLFNTTQNYSQWDMPFKSKGAPMLAINKDYDIIDATKISEWQRGLYLSHYEAQFYDFYPMLSLRESRRPHGLYQLSLEDAIQKRWHEDTIINAYSDFDPHYYSNAEYTRCALLLPHSNLSLVNIPYRSIVPKNIDGLLFSGRAISQTHIALQFTRMSADVSLLGHVTGIIASDILNSGISPRGYSVQNRQKEWIDKGILRKQTDEEVSVVNLLDNLKSGNEKALFKLCLMSQQEVLSILQETFRKEKNVYVAKALAWFRDENSTPILSEELKKLFEEEQAKGHASNYYEEYNPSILYWRINQLIAFLALPSRIDNLHLINEILLSSSSGGEKVPAKDAYNRNRIDLYLVPCYNRIINLCFFISRHPNEIFIKGLSVLLNDMYIRNSNVEDAVQTRWNVYSAYLELSIASCLARCGSLKGCEVLTEYLDDVHSEFREYARTLLKELTEHDFEYDIRKWSMYLKKLGKCKILPLQKRTVDK